MRKHVLVLALLLVCSNSSAKTTAESFKETSAKVLKDEECDKAKEELATAESACKAAPGIAKKACIDAEETQTARDIAECTKSDPIPECYTGARSAGATRVAACKSADYSENADVVAACDLDAVKAAKKSACK